MKKIYASFLLLICIPVFSLAQEQWKIPLSLYSKISKMDPAQPVGILVEGNPIAVAVAAKKYNGFLRYNQGTICSVQLPSGNVIAFSKEPGIIRLGNDANNKVLNDTMKLQSNVYPARNGSAPLTQGYSGNTIIIGLIDSGIDFNHPDFKDSAGNTRILKIWDQRDANGPGPAPWNYGTDWDSSQINAGSCTHNDLAYYGHGTGVSGLAAGDGSSVTAVDYSGVAPQADIIMVALDFNGFNSPVAVADAAAYIYQTAMALGRPCVINASVGDYLGSHDGQDLQALMIDTLLLMPSRSFVCAIGNAGSEKIHLSYPVTAIDTNFTWFVTGSGDIYIQTWADTNNFNAAKFAIGCTKDGSFMEKGRTVFSNFPANLNVTTPDSIMNSNGQRMATVLRYGSVQGSAASMEFLITPDSAAGYNFSLQMTGTGLFHCWSFDMYSSPLPNPLTYPKILFYKSPDTTHTVCSSFQCSDKTICVGNYTNRSSWMSYNGTRTYDPTVVGGDIMWNSSVGPTRDGRIRPDITAPGANTISCGVISSMPSIISSAPQYVGVGGFHVAGGGSSASSPVVAGCVALYLERFPTAGYSQIKTAVTSCAHTDNFTGVVLPDNTWGYGKVDAFSMLTNCGLSVAENNAGGNYFQLYPNPVNGNGSFQLQFNALEEESVMEIYSLSGQVIFSQPLFTGAMNVTIAEGLMSSGIYLVRISNDHFSNAQKLIVE
ncbi:MAG: S8 family peptidase [Bacteroidota bacterium]|nr:S8 family peptidase [Bacteroidota bacterium]